MSMVMIMLSLLSVQFLTGMYANLFVPLYIHGGPVYGMYGMMNFMFLAGGALMPHMALGMVIAVFAVFVFAISALVPNRNLLPATAGLVSALLAGAPACPSCLPASRTTPAPS